MPVLKLRDVMIRKCVYFKEKFVPKSWKSSFSSRYSSLIEFMAFLVPDIMPGAHRIQHSMQH
eukprot:768473-Hanusia_phi.AAC.21